MSSKRKTKGVLSLFMTGVLSITMAIPAFADPETPSVQEPTALIATQAVKVARVTGATPSGETLPNPTPTTPYSLNATDLGIMWDDGFGKVMTVFGDSFDSTWGGNGGGGGGWRSNVMGLSEDTDLSDGMSFSSMITDNDGKAKEIISSAHNTSGTGDFTAIPTAGISVGKRNFVHYMQIKAWGDPGKWTTNFSEIAYSDDEGQTWTKSGVKWAGSSKFAMAAYAKQDGYVYMFGTPSGRFGGVSLARVPEDQMLSIGSYEYWDGSAWANNEAAAVTLVDAPVGELSVAYNTHFNKWMMTYLNEDRAAIVLRSSSSLSGPWSAETEIAKGSQYPQLYGAFIHPWTNNGTDLYFTMAQWAPYNVFLMHSTLSLGNPVENMMADPGFEKQTSGTLAAPWVVEGNGGVDFGLGNSRSGANNVWLRNVTGKWNAVTQQVGVEPNTKYRLSAFVRTSPSNNGGYFGVRGGGSVAPMNETSFGALNGYTKLTVDFDSGDNTSVTVYLGMWPNGDTWVQADDFSLMPLDLNPPVITLKGDAAVEIPLGDTYNDPGATALDGVDGDLSAAVQASGTVNTNIVGTYAITYNVTDSDGNAAVPVTRTVTVSGMDYTIGQVSFQDSAGNSLTALPKGGFVMASAAVTNNTGAARDVTLVVALYNKSGDIESLSTVSKAVASSTTETFSGGFNLPNGAAGSYMEVFVWDSLTGMHPLSNVARLQRD